MFSPSLSSPCHGFQVFVKVELRETAVGSSLKEDDAGPGCHSNDPASDSIPGGCRRALKQTLAVAGARTPGEGVSGFLLLSSLDLRRPEGDAAGRAGAV